MLVFDLPSEGVVGTVIRRLEGTQLREVYADPASVCRPATLRDLDGDGVPELIAYPEDASGGDCSSECHDELRARFGTGPSWVRVHRWTGSGWEPDERRFPAFYGELARSYDQLIRWVEDNNPELGLLGEDAARCVGYSEWFSADPFRGWRRRASHLAGSGNL